MLQNLTDILSVRFMILAPISTAKTSLPKTVLFFSSWKKWNKTVTWSNIYICIYRINKGDSEVFFLTEARLMNLKRDTNSTLMFWPTAWPNASFDTVTDLENWVRVSLPSIICREEHNKWVVKIMYSVVFQVWRIIILGPNIIQEMT